MCVWLWLRRTLAGSTIMLLTLPWLGSLILGRVDIVRGVGKDETRSKFTLKSFFKQVRVCVCEYTYTKVFLAAHFYQFTCGLLYESTCRE